MLLAVEGYRCHGGRIAAQRRWCWCAEGKRIDLLVTDYHLSDEQLGTHVIAALRELLGIPLKAVLMTGDTSSAIKELPDDLYVRSREQTHQRR